MDGIKKLSNTKGMRGICAFFESAAFPVLLGSLIVSLYVCDLPVTTLIICAVCASFICLFCEDTRPVLAILLLAVLSLRYRDNPSMYFSSKAQWGYVVCGVILLFCAGYRLIMRRQEYRVKSTLIGMALFSCAILIGGAFTSYYNLKNILYACGRISILLGAFAFFALTMKKGEDNLLYLARVCAIAVCMIAFQILVFYIRNYTPNIRLDSDWKDEILLGWGISNMAGEMIAFLFPAVFYLIYKEKYGFLYWFVIVVGALGIYFTLSRNAILWGGATVVLGTVLTCVMGKNRRINFIIALSLFVLLVGAVVGMYNLGYLDKYLEFFKQAQTSDRGRFNLWGKHLELFMESPLQGVGFKAYTLFAGTSRVSYAHNNPLQMLASTGVIGLSLYFIHRVQTVYLICKEPTVDRLFMGGCIAVILCMGLLSSIFFYFYAMIYYMAILLVLDKSCVKEGAKKE